MRPEGCKHYNNDGHGKNGVHDCRIEPDDTGYDFLQPQRWRRSRTTHWVSKSKTLKECGVVGGAGDDHGGADEVAYIPDFRKG